MLRVEDKTFRFVGRLLAILILLQAAGIGAASQTMGREEARSGEAILFATSDCSLDAAAGEKSPHRRPHADCCILCSIGCSDKLAFQLAVLLARAEFQAPKRTIAVARADGSLSLSRSAWTGSASSRGPPLIS